jgi:glucokinase
LLNVVTEQNGSKAKLVFAADLGGTHLRGALVDEQGEIRVQLKQETPKGESPTGVVNALVDAASECERRLGKDFFSASSILVPGTLDYNAEVVLQAPNLQSLERFALKAALEERFHSPVLLENDANAAAVGEMWLGAARGAKNIICITLGTGVGSGIILDGKLWRGTDGSAAEIGHTTVDPFGGPQCKCGNFGCLEMYASATAMVRMTREALDRFPGSSLHGQCLSAKTIYDAGKAGDELAIEVFRNVGDYLGVALSNLINLLGPEVIVIGGGAANAWNLFEESMRKQIDSRAFPWLSRSVKIKPAECGDNAGLLGAAQLAFVSHVFES